MAKIRMKTTLGSTTEQVFSSFLAAAAARGVKEKTLDTYKQHFRSISKRLNTFLSIKELSKEDLNIPQCERRRIHGDRHLFSVEMI